MANNQNYNKKRKISESKINSNKRYSHSGKRRRINKKKMRKVLLRRGTSLTLAVLATIAIKGEVSKIIDKHTMNTIGIPSITEQKDGKEETIPVELSDGSTYNLESGTLILAQTKNPEAGKQIKITAIDDQGQVIEGTVDGKNIISSDTMKKGELEDYNIIYNVVSKEGAVIRSTPSFEPDGKISELPDGAQVLGKQRALSDYDGNKFAWTEVIYVDDINETPVTGYVRADLLKAKSKIGAKDKQEIVMSVDTSKDEGIDLNLRRNPRIPRIGDNVVEKIPTGSIVKVIEEKTTKKGKEQRKWYKVKYETEDGKEQEGWASAEYLREYEVPIKVVNMPKGGTLNIRENPGLGENVIARLENGTEIAVEESGTTDVEKDGINWTKIRLSDDTVGYASSEYLKDKEKEKTGKTEIEEIKQAPKITSSKDQTFLQSITSKMSVRKNGNVVGIDLCEMNPAHLDKLLKSKNAIGNYITKNPNTNGEYRVSTSDVAGKIDYVYIKIGASGYVNFQTISTDGMYKKLAEVCETNGVPYGFYYYSTAINNEEAKIEADFVINELDKLESTKYNLLPVAIDVEIAKNDRQLGHDVTEAKATLANEISKKHGHTILYGAGPAMLEPDGVLTKIMDLDKYEKLLENGQEAIVWLPTGRNTNNEQPGKIAKRYIETLGKKMHYMTQTVLDAWVNIPGTNKKGDIDINIAPPEKLAELLLLNQKDKDQKLSFGDNVKEQDDIELA